MNKKDKLIKEREYLDLIDFNVQSKRKQGVAKCWKGVSYPHWRVMSDIVWKLVNEYEMTVYTETTFKKGGRADILAFSGPLIVIVEVLHSENEKKFSKKKSYYPKGIPIIKVKTEGFNVENFKI